MKSNYLVTIIVLNWNGYDDTVECIESLLTISYSNYKIMIIDNDSKSNEYQKLLKLYSKNKKIILIKNNTNLGFAGGVNVGIQMSEDLGADFVLLLNNDTIVEKNFLDELIDVAKKDSNIGVLSSNIYYYNDPNKIWANGSYFNYYFPPLSQNFNSEKPGEVTDVVGCAMLIRMDTIKEIGKLDEDYFAYGEESDFNFRLTHKSKYKIYVAPKSVVWHKVSSSTGGGFNKIVAYLKMRNKIKFGFQNYPLHYWPSYIVFLILFFIKQQIFSLYKKNFSTSRALLIGARDGITRKKFDSKVLSNL